MTGKKKKNKKWIIILVVLLVAAVGVMTLPRLLMGKQTAAVTQNIRSTSAESGTIEKTVAGTGNLSADDNIEDMDIPDNITITDVLVEAGDTVKKGDTVATLDPIALLTAIYDTQDAISSLDTQLDTAKAQTESQYISSSISGRIKQILVEDGDDVKKTMTEDKALMVLSIDGKMIVSFIPAVTDGLTVGDAVTVTLSDGTEKDGTIISISADQCSVTISDKGPAVNVSVIITNGDTQLGSGILQINKPLSISGTNGKVADILQSVDDYVYEGSNLIKLEDATISRKYDQLYADRLAKSDLLNILLTYQETNSITAVFDGTIQSVMISDGQSTADSSQESTGTTTSAASTGTSAASSTTAAVSQDSGSSSAASAATSTSSDKMTAFTIKTDSKMELKAEIDELDILSLAAGQKAGITLDALPDQTFEGIITKISDAGTVSAGVTTYEVTLSVTEDLSMKVGMNASATIIIEKRENIVKIPLEALQESGKEQFVYIGSAAGETSLGEKRTVTTGISDGEFVEITKGLAAGEKINYIYTSGTETSAAASPFGGGGMGGGLGGNASSGGSMGGSGSSAGSQIPGTSD